MFSKTLLLALYASGALGAVSQPAALERGVSQPAYGSGDDSSNTPSHGGDDSTGDSSGKTPDHGSGNDDSTPTSYAVVIPVSTHAPDSKPTEGGDNSGETPKESSAPYEAPEETGGENSGETPVTCTTPVIPPGQTYPANGGDTSPETETSSPAPAPAPTGGYSAGGDNSGETPEHGSGDNDSTPTSSYAVVIPVSTSTPYSQPTEGGENSGETPEESSAPYTAPAATQPYGGGENSGETPLPPPPATFITQTYGGGAPYGTPAPTYGSGGESSGSNNGGSYGSGGSGYGSNGTVTTSAPYTGPVGSAATHGISIFGVLAGLAALLI